MAFGKATASSEGSNFKHFIGVGSFRVMGVNPTKDEMARFYGAAIEKEPEYVTKKTDDKTHEEYLQARVTFLVQADKLNEKQEPVKGNEALDEDLKTNISFFIENRYEYNTDRSKVKVIDKYGRTAWVPVEQAKNHQIPVYSNGPAHVDKDYRPCLRGEEELVLFMQKYLCIPQVESYNKTTGQWIPNPTPADCECGLDDIQGYFKGNIKQLREAIKLLPFNRVKILLGAKTTDKGNVVTVAYTKVTFYNGSTNFSKAKDEIDATRQSGGLQSTVFSDASNGLLQPIHEYKPADVQETDLSKKPAAAPNPFEQADNDLPF